LIVKPELMLYDEPTTGLDPITAKEISKLIVDVQHKYKTTSVIITHDIECARITANRLTVINEGLCIAEGAFDEMIKSEDRFVKAFFK
jgi:phospholipid/cholesterol/gamma-HCH transport system ATP-binding protein